jgi:sirohydrochlorin cobaltochelatase
MNPAPHPSALQVLPDDRSNGAAPHLGPPATPAPIPPEATGPVGPRGLGLILFAHGARDPRWAQPFEAVAQALSPLRPDVAVHLAFLEFMSPTLLQAGEAAVAQGCTQVQVLPMFLGAGGHVRKDLPELMNTLRSLHPGVQWHLQPAIGEQASVVQAMALAVAQGLPLTTPSAATAELDPDAP